MTFIIFPAVVLPLKKEVITGAVVLYERNARAGVMGD